MSKSKCKKHTSVGPLLEVAASKKCTPFWREAHFEVKMNKTPQSRSTFGSCDVEKVHAVLARSTFRSQNEQTPQCRTTFGSRDVEKVHAVVVRSTCRSQNVKNTLVSDHFWKLRRRKSARRSGAKHISKSKCKKHTSVGPLLEVAASKKCTPFWREAHFEVKMNKHRSVGPLLEVVMSKKCRPLWREAHFEVKSVKLAGTEHFWTFSRRFAWQAQGVVHLVKTVQNVRVL